MEFFYELQMQLSAVAIATPRLESRMKVPAARFPLPGDFRVPFTIARSNPVFQTKGADRMTTGKPDAWSLFLTAHALVVEEIENRLSAARLPPLAWYDALWALERSPDGTARMFEMAERMVIARYNLTRLMDRIEAEGLVERFRSDEDRRATYARLTPKGRALRREMWKVYKPAINELFLSQLPVSLQAAMADGFRDIARHVRALNKEPSE
jgi:DNA-binding MarR family transcriptional regulator